MQAGDFDDDGWPDLFVANDGLNAYLYHNEHNGTFKEIGLATGMAVTSGGASWPQCAFLWAIMTMMASSICTSRIFRALPIIFGTRWKGIFERGQR